ncbi:hypothetical protein EDF73_1215 [Raoultella sp. BIGb0138]|nr:hypothetical protein EDF73_1215 [Raoultella sp. BIGb0138]
MLFAWSIIANEITDQAVICQRGVKKIARFVSVTVYESDESDRPGVGRGMQYGGGITGQRLLRARWEARRSRLFGIKFSKHLLGEVQRRICRRQAAVQRGMHDQLF